MDAALEKDLEQMLEIATRIIDQERKPTDAERERFNELRSHMERQPVEWRERLADQINRLAAALEGMGI